MLRIVKDGQVVGHVAEGQSFRLPTGDHVSPAYAGWERGEFSLEAEPEPPPPTVEQLLAVERGRMELSFAQFIIGLTEQGWITEAEADAWLAGSALPAAVTAAISQIPAQAGEQKPRLRAKARALRPSTVVRTNELLALMAAQRGATGAQLDDLFRTYAAI